MRPGVTWADVMLMVPCGSLLRLPTASVKNPSPVLDADDVRQIAAAEIERLQRGQRVPAPERKDP